MSTEISWEQIALRLTLTVVAGALVGLDRGEHGRPAGLRTTILVALAAAISMIQVNILLPLAGKPDHSFIVMDLMRLPLGVLSGMGFIGGGAILRRGNLVTGVTTAATLWFVTILGLCFGGGQLVLGLAALAIGMIVLSGLRFIERGMKLDRRAEFVLVANNDGPTEEQIREALLSEFRILTFALSNSPTTRRRKIRCKVQWRARQEDSSVPASVARLSAAPGVTRVDWRP
ncbi:MAG TPA: MgtC/SapB family protein [Pirellulales bacterium]|jgi:putative Mg2+ transporter-C (MgtC) family protein